MATDTPRTDALAHKLGESSANAHEKWFAFMEQCSQFERENDALRSRLRSAECVLGEADHWARMRPWPEHEFNNALAHHKERFGVGN